MKKILLVTDSWAPQVNGVVRVQDAYIPRLEARGYEVKVIEPSQFFTVPMPFYPVIPLALFPQRRIAKLIDEYQPDALHIMTEGPLGWAVRRVALKRHIPFTTWYHSHFQLYLDKRLHGLLRPVFALIRRFHAKAERTIVSTPSLKKLLEDGGFEKNIAVVPLGVDTELFTRNREPALPALPKPVFVYFSRLATEKSPEDFLKLDLPGTKLVIGDGPERKRLEREYVDKAMFVGFKRGQELVDWLSLADVMVFPSKTETFGLVALEALSLGIPVAAYDVMGPRDVIEHGKHGHLGDDLAAAALACLGLSSEECRTLALHYSWDHSAEQFIKTLHFFR